MLHKIEHTALVLVLLCVTGSWILTLAAPPPSQAPAHGAQAATAASSTPTVGEFVLRYARGLNLASEHSTPAQALDALRAAGLAGSESYDLKAPLTEGDVVRLSQRMELDLVSEHPGREFSKKQADSYFEMFGAVLAEQRGAGVGSERSAFATQSLDAKHTPPDLPVERNPNAADPREQGNGRKRGLSAHFPFP